MVMLCALPLPLAAVLPPLLLAALVSGTAVPPPGPACLAGVPARNQSSPSGPDCPGQLLVHNASCAGEPGSLWRRRANFHPGSECHGENDPNGVMVYKGVYHLFFQDHNPMQLGGHLATTDFVHFKRLSIAIWNDRWYDKAAIWTFSATIVDGTPRIIYPGIAGTNLSNGDCGRASTGEGCFTHSLALPANASDPWLEDWEKPDRNPIVQRVNGTGINAASRDPSTAWRTSRGEWRYMNARADIFSSLDFLDWRWVGNLENFGTGDCPDFYPIPRDCDGCGPAADDAAGSVSPRPSHVRAGGFKGVYALGVYDEEGPNSTGSWHPLPQYDEFPIDPEQPKGQQLPMDLGGPTSYYAAKSFDDTVNDRRLVWAWIRLGEQALEAVDEEGDKIAGFHAGGCPGIGSVMTNTNSMAREITYDPQLQTLNYFPVSEMAALRRKVLGGAPAGTLIAPQKPLTLATEAGVIQSELRVSFALPTESVRVGVTLLGKARGGSTVIYIDFTPNPAGAGASAGAGAGAEPGSSGSASKWGVTAGVDQSSMLCPRYVRGAPPPALTNRTACPTSNG
eukprot:COSAG02_NODE_1337_length_13193_cov_9.142050_5_plen_565_part_00